MATSGWGDTKLPEDCGTPTASGVQESRSLQVQEPRLQHASMATSHWDDTELPGDRGTPTLSGVQESRSLQVQEPSQQPVAMATSGWDYTKLPEDHGTPTLSRSERWSYSKAFQAVLRSDPNWTHPPGGIPHPHGLPLVELLQQACVTRGPRGQAPSVKMLDKKAMMEVFAGNPEFHVEDVPDLESGALQTWVSVTEGPATCADCAEAGTVVGARRQKIVRERSSWWTRQCLEQ